MAPSASDNAADNTAADLGSHAEAAAAVVHHDHHPADPNVGVVRGRLPRGAVLAAVVSGALTILGVVLLAIAVGNR